MELRQLEHFLAVSHTGGFSAATEEVHLSQSALSSSIQSLERDLGVELFERSTRRVHLSVAGRALLPAARQILGDVRAARQQVTAVATLETGELALGTVQTLTAVDVPALLASYHEACPGVRVTLREAPVAELLDQLEAADLDLAFVARDATPLPRGLVAHRRYDEHLVLLVPGDHPLTRRLDRRVEFVDLAAEVFVDFQAGEGLQTVVEALCAEAGLARQIGFRVSQIIQVLELIRHGLGIAIIPEPIARTAVVGPTPGGAIITIGRTPPQRTLELVGRRDHPSNPAAAALLDLLS